MVGRAAYDHPWPLLCDADRQIFGEPNNPALDRRQVVHAAVFVSAEFPVPVF